MPPLFKKPERKLLVDGVIFRKEYLHPLLGVMDQMPCWTKPLRGGKKPQNGV